MVVCHIGTTVLEGSDMKKRLTALLLVLVLLLPVAVASAAWYRVTTGSLQVRQFDSESSKVLGSYRQDYALTIKNRLKNGWALVEFSNGFQGYVQTKYIKSGGSGYAYIYSDDTSLRTGPDGSFGAIAKLARGRRVSVLVKGAKYSYVNAGDMGKGYVVNSLLSKKKIKPSGNASSSTHASGGNYDAYVFNAGYRSVNLRATPEDNGPIVNTYPTGTKVHVISHNNIWDKVSVDGTEGWMKTQFLTTAVPAPTPTPTPGGGGGGGGESGYTAYVVVPNKGTLNIRNGGGTNYGTISKVRHGAAVKVITHGKSWDKIEYNGRTGWVMNKYLHTVPPSGVDPSSVPDPSVPTPTPKPFEPYNATVTVDGLNFHRGKGDGYSNVNGCGKLESGWTVLVLEVSGKWAKVEYDGYIGWVHKEYIKKQ